MKTRLLLLPLFLSLSVFSQNPTYQQKIYYTCKVWGFVKYYHSAVSTCQVNWDSVLVHYMPSVKNCVTQNDFNDVLDSMLLAAGPMQIAASSFPDTLAPELKRNRDWNWVNDTVFRSDVKTILDTIKNNFRPHAECWVQDNNYTNSYQGWLVFPHDSLMTGSDLYNTFPNEWNRELYFFRYWNIVNYFYPYKYVLTVPWDSTLYTDGIQIANATNYARFYLTLKKAAANLNDAHTEGLTWSSHDAFPNAYFYGPKLVLRRIPGKYVVVKSGVTGISAGDEVVSVNGLTTSQWEDSLRPYISAGDSSVFRREVAKDMLWGSGSSGITIMYRDSLNNLQTYSGTRNNYVYDPWFDYYPNDTLATATWKKWGCNTGYVNMGNLMPTDVNLMVYNLYNTSSIIFDIRNYPNGTAWQIAGLLYPQRMEFAKLTIPDVTYPGTFYWYHDTLGYNGSPYAYNGRVIILMNQETQSQAEYSCMILQAMPNAVTAGSQTAGADGNITYLRVSQDIHAGFTNLGVYYPNGDSTQRIGIVPDSLVYPTQAGIRQNRDEVLDKALEIAQCWVSVPEIKQAPSVSAFPNPASENLHVTGTNLSGRTVLVTLTDITGQVVFQKETSLVNGELNTVIDLSGFAGGMYFLRVENEQGIYSKKIIRQ